MPPVSPDNPIYFLTSVTHHRLPVFRKDAFKLILAAAFDEARKSGGFEIYAYVVMPDHYHIVTDGRRKASDVLRFLNGVSARRIIKFLKDGGHERSLEKLSKVLPGRKDHQYSVWEHHSNTFLITTESVLLQKVGYIHQNPVAEGLAEGIVDYKFSSARFWQRAALLEDEPLVPDIKSLVWRS